MDYTDFLEIYTKLESYYNKHDDNLRIVYYKSFNYMKKEQFNNLVNLAIEQCEYFPKIATLKDLKDQIKKEDYKPIQCPKCNGTGMRIYTKEYESYPYEYVMKCDCINAQRLSNLIPTASEVGIGDVNGNN